MNSRLVPLAEVDDALVEGWRRLASEALEPNPFADPDLVLPAGRRLGAGAAPALLVVEEAGELQLALPVVKVRQHRRLPVPAVTTWIHPYCFSGTPLVSGTDPGLIWRQALGELRGVAPWAVLPLLPSEGPVALALEAVQVVRGRRVGVVDQPVRPVLERGNEGYLMRMSGSRRSKLKRLRPRLAADHDDAVSVVDRARPGEDLDAAVQGFIDLEAAGWKGRDGGAMALHAGHAELFAEICRRFAGRGALQLRELRVGDQVIGYQCNLVAGDTLFGFKTTFDETFRRYSPGVILFLDTVQEFQSSGLRRYDSCLGTTHTAFHDLFPDRQPMADVLLSVRGVVGDLSAWAVPRAGVVYRRARATVADARERAGARRGADAGRAAPDAAG